jgi:hypothetical protein
MNQYRCSTCENFSVYVDKCPLWREKRDGDEGIEYKYWVDIRDELLPIVGCASHSDFQKKPLDMDREWYNL